MSGQVHTSGGDSGKLPGDLDGLLPAALRERFAASGNLCLSGAAPGADTLWGDLAWRRGHAVVHWSFAGHSRAECEGRVVELTQAQLTQADGPLGLAATALARPWPPRKLYSASLLRRNYFQAAYADTLYAIAKFDRTGRILGGTAWTVQMFLDRFAGSHVQAFVFDQQARGWLGRREGGWSPIAEPPAPAGIWAGIGTRDLSEAGIAAATRLLPAPRF